MPKKFNGDFREKLVLVHRTYWSKAYKRLMRKISILKSNLKKRSEEYEVKFDISLDELKQMFLDSYGEECKYCEKELNIRTIACDHIIPLSKGGESVIENLQLICKTCNTRKGPLDEGDYISLIDWVKKQTMEVREYVMKKLAKGGRY
jgi:5-methylcytosine-specific restriction endonuclease McrA|tara:strand:- start:3884 stop:4327 length:444 start_codon:yes stop_codon:yes gene_type:complete